MSELIFIGEYSKLKGMGFAFQPLPCSNRMAWFRGSDLFIIKRGKNFGYYDLPKAVVIHLVLMIQGGALFDQVHRVVQFPPPSQTEFKWLELFYNTETGEVTADKTEYKKARDKCWQAYHANAQEHVTNPWTPFPITEERFNEIKEFVDLGWLVVKAF